MNVSHTALETALRRLYLKKITDKLHDKIQSTDYSMVLLFYSYQYRCQMSLSYATVKSTGSHYLNISFPPQIVLLFICLPQEETVIQPQCFRGAWAYFHFPEVVSESDLTAIVTISSQV